MKFVHKNSISTQYFAKVLPNIVCKLIG